MIEATGLHKYFGKFHALSGINLNVRKGEIYGFIGRNGAGKSTTMNILAGISRSSSGECIVNGRNVREIKSPGELNIGYLPEEPKFYPWMTAYETLEYLGNGAGRTASKKTIEETLEWVGLESAASRRVGGFSRGMRQRLGIGAALIHDPKLVMLDEPSSALDPEGRSDVLRLIKMLKEQGRTVFLSTHILDDVERVCDRVGMLEGGRLILEKPLGELLNENLAPVFDITVRTNTTELTGAIMRLEGVTAVSAGDETLSVTVNDADRGAQVLMAYFSVKGLPVKSFELRKNRLEDIFIKEVNHDESNALLK